ncbi:hypothetical protein Tco_1448482 [Tanacetum coccineum]
MLVTEYVQEVLEELPTSKTPITLPCPYRHLLPSHAFWSYAMPPGSSKGVWFAFFHDMLEITMGQKKISLRATGKLVEKFRPYLVLSKSIVYTGHRLSSTMFDKLDAIGEDCSSDFADSSRFDVEIR